jgi:hypothetical protein
MAVEKWSPVPNFLILQIPKEFVAVTVYVDLVLAENFIAEYLASEGGSYRNPQFLISIIRKMSMSHAQMSMR